MKKRFPTAVVLTAAAFFICAVVLSAEIMTYNMTYGIAGIVSAAVLAVIAAVVGIVYSKNSMKRITKMNEHLENSAAEYMNTLPAPIAVINSENKCVWYNKAFSEKISLGKDVYSMDIEESTDINVTDMKTKGHALCRIDEMVYRVFFQEFTQNDIQLLILYFRDDTAHHLIKREYEESRPNVVIMNIDTYSEIMQNAKESDKARASMEIERLMEQFMDSTNGFIKRISSNTFYAVIEKRDLDEKINSKFKILDDARAIKIAGKYPLTLSIGVGIGANNLAESEKIARQCLDMALGRGGDQAVVKTYGGYRFFGGVSKGVEKMSRTKTRIIANAMQDVISNSGKVYIMGHRFGDLDSVGASCGMAGALRLMGKDVKIVVDRQKNLASHLIDIIAGSMGDDLFITPAAAMASVNDSDLLIVVDTHNPDVLESRELYEQCCQVVVIDHHRKTVKFIDNAVIFYHEPNASSASEMVTEIIQYFKSDTDEKLPVYCAEALLAGIMLDTKNFVMRTGVRTFEAAAFLKKLGADTVAVKLLFSNTFESYKRRAEIVSSAKIHNNCAIATADFKCDDIRIVAPQAADEMLNITDVDASFVIFKTGNTVNISGRSLGAVNVQVIMELLGGGGHQTMAAAQMENVTLQEALKSLIQAIDKREEEQGE